METPRRLLKTKTMDGNTVDYDVNQDVSFQSLKT